MGPKPGFNLSRLDRPSATLSVRRLLRRYGVLLLRNLVWIIELQTTAKGRFVVGGENTASMACKSPPSTHLPSPSPEHGHLGSVWRGDRLHKRFAESSRTLECAVFVPDWIINATTDYLRCCRTEDLTGVRICGASNRSTENRYTERKKWRRDFQARTNFTQIRGVTRYLTNAYREIRRWNSNP